MAIELINVGRIANDGTGDDLREAMIKINQNFEELDLANDLVTTGSNLGNIGESIFFNRVNYDLQFKKIAAGDNIELTSDLEKVTINSTGLKDITVLSNNGSTVLENSAELIVAGGDGITTSIVNGQLTITNDYVSEVEDDTTPSLGGDLDAKGFNINNVGNLTGLVNGVDPSVNNYYFDNIELGGIFVNISSSIELFVATLDFDLGTFSNPSIFSIDEGTL